MLLNILYLTFVGTFIAVVVLGHVLLAAAIWPKAFATMRSSLARQRASAADAAATPEVAAKAAVIATSEMAA